MKLSDYLYEKLEMRYSLWWAIPLAWAYLILLCGLGLACIFFPSKEYQPAGEARCCPKVSPRNDR